MLFDDWEGSYNLYDQKQKLKNSSKFSYKQGNEKKIKYSELSGLSSIQSSRSKILINKTFEEIFLHSHTHFHYNYKIFKAN